MSRKYVLPVPYWLREKLLCYNRLYAYPTIPEKNPAILDSGAFGMRKSKKLYSDEYFQSLSIYYEKYGKLSFCVAPDIYLRQKITMDRYKKWMLCNYSEVCPVLQFSQKKMNLTDAFFQMDFYREFTPKFRMIFVSNPGMRSVSVPKQFFSKLKENYDIKNIHFLGAGWDLEDIMNYSQIKGWNSMDSIAYYNHVRFPSGNWTKTKGDKVQIAVKNAEFANKIYGNV